MYGPDVPTYSQVPESVSFLPEKLVIVSLPLRRNVSELLNVVLAAETVKVFPFNESIPDVIVRSSLTVVVAPSW